MSKKVHPKRKVFEDELYGKFIENKIAENNGYALYLFDDKNPYVDLIADALTLEEIKEYFPDVELKEGGKYSVLDSDGLLVFNEDYKAIME